MIYNVVCEKGDASKASDFEARLANLCSDVCQYASNAWFVSYDSERTLLFSQLREVVDPGDTLVVNSVDFTNMSGWMSSTAIDWIKKYLPANDK